MWNVIVRAPRSVDLDVVKYKFYRDGIFDGETAQPVSGDALYTYQIPDDGKYFLQVVAVDGADLPSPEKSDPLIVQLDHMNPAKMDPLILVSATWVP